MISGIEGNNITQLLLLLCNDFLTDKEKLLAREIAATVSDWDRFSDLAIKNGVAALIWVNIDDCGLTGMIPREIQNKLEALKNQTLARITFLSVAATDITTLLEAKGIRPLLLKGLALEHTVYGNRGMRQMNDADILVSPDQCIDAWNILQDEGYICRPLKSTLYKKLIMCLGNHLPELHRNGISVDIHHRLFLKEGSLVTQKGFTDAGQIQILGTRCYILPPDVAFLGMIKHIQKHGVKGEFQVRLYIDLYLMLKYYSEEILTPFLFGEAEEAGISKELSAALFLLSQNWEVQIPEIFPQKLSEAEKQEYLSMFLLGLTNPGKADPEKNRDIYEYNLRSVPGVANKIIFLAGDIFPSLTFMKDRYKGKSIFAILLHYPLRFGKIIWFLRAVFKSK
jgi:hypothetical protein